jgi:Holliday junction resolvasome RuvABC DNA-binding subunit
MVRDQRAEAASTWTHEERDARREGHVDKRHGVQRDTRRARGEHPADKHREVDRELRRIATQRTGLDAQEARWLREAERHQIWRRLGFSTALEYLEDVFGYAPRTAMERLRVAKELGELPELEAELASGALPYSAAKELCRVMTRHTQAEWLARARGKNLRDIEEMVAGRKKGDRPDDLPDPALVVHDIRLKLTARTKALWEQMRAALERECDGQLDDDQLAEVVTRRVLGGDDARSDKPPRPPHRIVVHQCDDCGRAWQEARGRWIQLSEADRALAACDAVTVHEHDQATSSATTSDIPAKTRKRVWARDRGRCRVPGCRATRHIDIHHLIPRALGGTHGEWSLCLLCSGHHKLHHDGILSITGRAPDELVFIRDGKRLVDARSDAEASGVATLPSTVAAPSNRFAEVTKLEHAKQALRQLGFKARAARAALEQATAHVGTDADVAQLVHAALQLSRPDEREITAATRDTVGEDEMTKLATQALVQLGYPRPIATNAVNAASAHVGGGDLAALIKEALRRTSS